MSSGKWRPFCLDLNELTHSGWKRMPVNLQTALYATERIWPLFCKWYFQLHLKCIDRKFLNIDSHLKEVCTSGSYWQYFLAAWTNIDQDLWRHMASLARLGNWGTSTGIILYMRPARGERTLQCNIDSHWLGACTKRSLPVTHWGLEKMIFRHFKCISLKKNHILIKISLQFVPKGQVYNKPALLTVVAIARHQTRSELLPDWDMLPYGL